MGYTYTINYHKKALSLGWVHQSFRTTDDALKLHIKSLWKQQAKGQVRNIEVVKLK